MVRPADGETAYYAVVNGYVNSVGARVGQRGRLSQAHRFATEDEARRVASQMRTNSMAREYLVVPLPMQRR